MKTDDRRCSCTVSQNIALRYDTDILRQRAWIYNRKNIIRSTWDILLYLLQDLEYLLHVVRAQNSNSRERRQRSQQGYRCSFYVSEPTIVRGYCYYDFGNIVTCKSGNKLSFEAAECPRSRPGT